MEIDASRNGDRCIRGWRSIHHGMASQPPRMAIDASRDGDRCIRDGDHASLDGYHCIPGWRSRIGDRCIPGWRSMHPGMAIDASRDGDRCIPGWRSMHPGMVIIVSRDGDLDMTIDASRDGDRSIPGWLSFSSRDMASWAGDRSIPGWRSMHSGMVIMHPRMVTIASRYGDLEMTIDASRDGDRSIPGWLSFSSREFGTPDLWHPHAKYPREIGTPKQNMLREFGTPWCTPWGIWHPVTIQLNVYQRIKARHC